MSMELYPFLADVEERIDGLQEEKLVQQWLQFCDGSCPDPFFSPRRRPVPAGIDWPRVYVNRAFGDVDTMVYTQLKGVSDLLAGETGLLLHVRPNYGTGIIPTMFGAELFYLDEQLDTLPGTRPLEGGVEALREIVLAHHIDYSRGLAPQVFAFGQRWKELTKDFPGIRRWVHVYNPDLQGPFPLADMLAGSEIYYALYDEPELIADALEMMTEIYLDFTRRWQALCPPFDRDHSVEWGLLHRGGTILRNDAVTNLSEQMYREHVMAWDQKVFDELGGGMHFCGRGDHYIGAACSLRNLSCINMSQPELNDMEKIYQATVDRGIRIIGMPPAEIQRAGAAGRNLRGLVQSGAALSAYRD